ncbi:MAG: hypothetical protein WCH29_09395 [Chitinophagaceae bacterium]
MKLLITLIFFLGFYSPAISQKPKIEIYLLKKRFPPIEKEGLSFSRASHFNVTSNDIQDSAFILDTEILNYDSSKNIFRVAASASLKISSLDPSISEGIQFTLAIDKRPILNGYFINKFTSSPLLSYMIMNRNDSIYSIDRLMPGIKNDDRKNPILINAFKVTARLE